MTPGTAGRREQQPQKLMSSRQSGITSVSGPQWIVTTPTRGLDKHDRRRIKGNAIRSRVKQRDTSEFRSWISPSRELYLPKRSWTARETGIPLRAGADFSGLRLPSGIEPYMIQRLVKVFEIGQIAVYPYEICIQVPPVERGWFPYMLSDPCCVHSLMFSVQMWEDRAANSQLSRAACIHYARTLQLLQARLMEYDATNAVSDATIIVVIMLAIVAGLTNDFATLENHIRGLEKIVKLRGGVRALTTHTNMPVKVCRADLSFALSTGNPPFLFENDMSWNCFIAGHCHLACSHIGPLCKYSHFTSMDSRLLNVSKDVHALSCLSNLAHQTGRKLSPEMYNEMMISILYRLVRLSFAADDVQEAFRLGLLCFCSTIFMHRQHMEQQYKHLLSSFQSSLQRLHAVSASLGDPVVFWLLMTFGVTAKTKYHTPSQWNDAWLAEIIATCGLGSWSQARQQLHSIAWIDFAHDRLGERMFNSAKEISIAS